MEPTTTNPEHEKHHLSFGVKVMLLLVAIFALLLVWLFIARVQQYQEQIETGTVDYSSFQAGAFAALTQDYVQTNPNAQYINNFADDPSFGPQDAELTVVLFEDFECPFCGALYPNLKYAMQTYGDRVRFVYRDFPVPEIHPNAQKAAEAGQCAHDQGRFWEYHDVLYQNQHSLGVTALKNYAKQLGLNQQDFDFCLDSGKNADEVQSDFKDGVAAGVPGTPGLFFNGELISGVVSADGFDQIIALFITEDKEKK